MPACSRARSSSLPAGPTKGRPSLSSLSPGCSPMKIARAVEVPSPKTVCVPVLYRGQAVQPAAAARSFAREGLSGTSGAAVGSSACAMRGRYTRCTRDPPRDQRLRLQALARRLLSGGPAGQALARPLLARVLDRRAQHDVLPATDRERSGRLEGRDPEGLSLRGQGQPVPDAHEAAQGSW